MRNRCLLITSKLSVGVCRCPIWASSTNNPTLSQPSPSSTRLPTSLTTVTNGHDQPRRVTARHRPQQSQHDPKEQKRRSNATSPPTARKRAPGALHRCATSLSATWQTMNDDISRRLPFWSEVSAHSPSPLFHICMKTRCHVAAVSDVAIKW